MRPRLVSVPRCRYERPAKMLFHHPDYLLFLAIVTTAWWLLAQQKMARLALVFLASCVFYMAWNPRYIVLILGSTVLDFLAGQRIFAAKNDGQDRQAKLWLSASLAGNLGLLFAFKYYNFFAIEASAGLAALGIEGTLPLLRMALPVGISFYTFQTLSYTIDIYRGNLKPVSSLLQFAAFVTYFPQLVAGPIVRATELLPQLKAKTEITTEKVSRGLFLILTGLVKKVALADYLAVNLADRLFDQPELFSSTETVIGLYAFTMQLYLDFSGYTDVARGSAMLMGLELPRNFDRPYQAKNPAEFWRRWHMTLSRWLRDYLYFPLGGSRVGPVRAYFNLALTMFLVGIWHGWWRNFEVFFWYALLQATAMVLHRFYVRRRARPKDAVDPWHIVVLKTFLSLQFVVFSRILFRAESMENAGAVAGRLQACMAPILEGGEEGWMTFQTCSTSTAQVTLGLWLVLIGTFVAHYTPRRLFESFEAFFVKLPAPAQGLLFAGTAAILSLVAASEAAPYIYFQF